MGGGGTSADGSGSGSVWSSVSARGEASSASMRSPSSGVIVSCEALSSASSEGDTVSRSQPASATISRVFRNEAAMISVPTAGRPHLFEFKRTNGLSIRVRTRRHISRVDRVATVERVDALGPELVQLVDARDALHARVRLTVLQAHRVLLLRPVRHVPVVDAAHERRDELRAHVARHHRLHTRNTRTLNTYKLHYSSAPSQLTYAPHPLSDLSTQ